MNELLNNFHWINYLFFKVLFRPNYLSIRQVFFSCFFTLLLSFLCSFLSSFLFFESSLFMAGSQMQPLYPDVPIVSAYSLPVTFLSKWKALEVAWDTMCYFHPNVRNACISIVWSNDNLLYFFKNVWIEKKSVKSVFWGNKCIQMILILVLNNCVINNVLKSYILV